LNLTGKTFADIVADNTDVVKYINDDTIIEIFYIEYIDFEAEGYTGAERGEVIRGWGYGKNSSGNVVPVLYKTDDEGPYTPFPDLEEALYYEGTATLNGTTCDKWRKISSEFTWGRQSKAYYYTTRVVNTTSASTLFSPNIFPEKIDEVYEIGQSTGTGGGTDTSDATATAADILSGKTAYTSTGKITGTIAFQNAKTITPGTSNITAISKGYYASGSVIVSGSANLAAANIKSGVNIFGVTGTYAPTATSDYTREDAIVDGTFSGNYMNSRVEYIGSYKFYNVPITNAVFQNVTTMGVGAFSACYSLRAISFPVCTAMPMSAFAGCRSLSIVWAPACRKVGQMAFYRCSNLSTIELPVCSTISANAFAGCTTLSDITIGTSNCVLANSTAFANTKITSSTGAIRVPSAYVSAYKSSTNWSYFSNRIYRSQ
jgi:hypothetical protein